MAISLKSPNDVLQEVRDRFKRRRLALNLTQAGLAKRSGVALGSLKRFETSGLVAFDSLLKLALVLDCLGDFDGLADEDAQAMSGKPLDEVLAGTRTRKKGRMA
ncbi:MAG: XRE family transcriptional regulator [Hyphomicrobium sp.]|nr:XRE family transcriptional regulator [Hyphomicrobium sp.]PPC80018.1 MAG: transcriptional regulator [Hyphomicrobium sp.]